MAVEWTSHIEAPLDARELLSVLNEHEVKHVLVGGLAAIAHGFSGFTNEADIVPDWDGDNLGRLAAALVALGAKVYAHPDRSDLLPGGAPPEAAELDLADPSTLRRQVAWSFSTAAGRLDVLSVIDGPGGYEVLVRRARRVRLAAGDVLVAGLDDLIEAKQTAGRPKDLAMLDELIRLRPGPAAKGPPKTR